MGHPVIIKGTVENPSLNSKGSSPVTLKNVDELQSSFSEDFSSGDQEMRHKELQMMEEMALNGIYPRALTEQELIDAGKMDSSGNFLRDAVGDGRNFYVKSYSDGNYYNCSCTCRAVGENCYVYIDDYDVDTAPIYNDPNTYAADMADYFDNIIYPLVHQHIGTEWTPGVDGDPRVYLVFSSIIYGNAYFSLINEYPKASYYSYTALSNECESVYIDPLMEDGTQPPENTIEAMEAAVGHEFTHLVRNGMKFFVPDNIQEKLSTLFRKSEQDDGLDEGTAIFTENILLHRSITDNYPSIITPNRAIWLNYYLTSMESYPFTSDYLQDGATYYASGMTITHYLYEREGYGALTALNESDGKVGLECCREISGFDELFDMMALTMILSGRVTDTNYTMESWDLSGSTVYQGGIRLHNAWSVITNCEDYEEGIDVSLLASAQDIPEMTLYEWAPMLIRFTGGEGTAVETSHLTYLTAISQETER